MAMPRLAALPITGAFVVGVVLAGLILAIPYGPSAAQSSGREWCSCADGTNFRCDSGFRCPGTSQSGGSGGSGGSGAYAAGAEAGRRLREALIRLFSGDPEKKRRQRSYETWAERQYGPQVDRILREAEQSKARDSAEIQQAYRAETRRLVQAEHAYKRMTQWNDAGFDAYKNKEWGRALNYFRAAQVHAPNNPDIRYNIQRAEEKTATTARKYLASVKTALAVKSLSPWLMLFHPDPYVRMEAQKQLARESMEKIAEAAAQFVVSEHLRGGRIRPFKWESPAERAARKAVAKRHAENVARLLADAFAEAREISASLDAARLRRDQPIRVRPGSATTQLLRVSEIGFE